MSHRRSQIQTTSSRRRAFAGALATTLLSAAPASAFFQQTTLEGSIGTDIGGVWLSVQQILPEFRITYQKPAEGRVVPVTVGPIPADLEPITGKNAKGVLIAKCDDQVFCNTNGLMEGDILIQVNSANLNSVADWDAATSNPPAMIMLSVRRPALRLSTTRLVKIQYSKEGKEEAGSSTDGPERLNLQVLDVKLPFADAVEATRVSHAFFKPTDEQLKSLAEKWFDLPPNDPQRLMGAKHRFVMRDSFDDALESDASVKDAKAAIVMDMQGNPLKGGGGKIIDIYGLETIGKDELAGNYVTVTIANAPFPINIEFKGRYRMYRVADWSEKDSKLRMEREGTAQPEDLNKYKTLPDVPGEPDKK